MRDYLDLLLYQHPPHSRTTPHPKPKMGVPFEALLPYAIIVGVSSPKLSLENPAA